MEHKFQYFGTRISIITPKILVADWITTPSHIVAWLSIDMWICGSDLICIYFIFVSYLWSLRIINVAYLRKFTWRLRLESPPCCLVCKIGTSHKVTWFENELFFLIWSCSYDLLSIFCLGVTIFLELLCFVIIVSFWRLVNHCPSLCQWACYFVSGATAA